MLQKNCQSKFLHSQQTQGNEYHLVHLNFSSLQAPLQVNRKTTGVLCGSVSFSVILRDERQKYPVW